MLEVRGLKKRLGGRPVLDGVNLDVAPGERVALCGPSGSGKTTLLRLICGFEAADAGRIVINGVCASDPRVRVPPHRRGVGLVFQNLALWPHMTAGRQVAFMLPREVRTGRERRRQAAALLDSVRLGGRETAYPHTLSGGEQRRLALARSLAAQPAMLLLDEPFTSLETDLKIHLLTLVRELQEQRGFALLYVTHLPDEITPLAHRIVSLRAGRTDRETARHETDSP